MSNIFCSLQSPLVQVEDWDLVGANDFLGQVRLPLAGLGTHRKTHRAWHKLQPRSTNGRPPSSSGAKPNTKMKSKHNESGDPTAAAGSVDKDDPYGRGEVYVCLRWIHDGERERELYLRQRALDLLLKRPVPLNPSPGSEAGKSSTTAVAAAGGGAAGAAALAKQNRKQQQQQRLMNSGQASSNASTSTSEPYDKAEAQAAVQRASVLASMWCRVAALALARHVKSKSSFPGAKGGALTTMVSSSSSSNNPSSSKQHSPLPPNVIGISSVFSELPLFVRPAMAVPLAIRGVRSLATHADHFPLPGGTLAQKRAAAAARAAESATLTRKKRHHHKGGQHATGAAPSEGEGGSGEAAVMPVKPTAEEDAHAAALLARRVKAAQVEERRAARRSQNTNKLHHKHHGGSGNSGGPSRVKVVREAPPPDPQRWLLKPLPFTLEAKAHLMPILS